MREVYATIVCILRSIVLYADKHIQPPMVRLASKPAVMRHVHLATPLVVLHVRPHMLLKAGLWAANNVPVTIGIEGLHPLLDCGTWRPCCKTRTDPWVNTASPNITGDTRVLLRLASLCMPHTRQLV